MADAATPAAAPTSVPPAAAIEFLRTNPNTAEQFEAKFGKGTAAQYAEPEGHLESIGRGIVRGVAGAVRETVETAADMTNYAITDPLRALGGLGPTPKADLEGAARQAVGNDAVDAVSVDAPEHLSGKLAEGLTQFVTGLAGLGKFTKLAEIPAAVTKLGKIADAGLRSAAVSAAAFEPYEGNVANFVEQFPSLQNPVSDFMAVDDNDTAVEARLKNALADLTVGVPIDGMLTGLKAIRAKGQGRMAEAQAHLERLSNPEVPPEAPPGTAGTRPAGEEVKMATVANPPIRPGADVAQEMIERIKNSNDDVDLAKGVEANSKPPVAPWDRFFSGNEDFNFRKIIEANAGKEPYAALSVLDEMGQLFRTEIDSARGGAVETLQETKVQADNFARKAGQDPNSFFNMLAGDAKSAQKVAGRLKAYKDVTLTLADSVQQLARQFDEGRPGDHGTMEALGAEMIRRNEFLSNVLAMTKVVQTGTARAVSAGRLGARVNPRLLKAIESGRVAGQLAPDQKSLQVFARAVASAGTPDDVLRLANVSKLRYAGDAISRFWVNSILSGPATHIVNGVSNTLKTITMPAERFLAGAFGGNKAEMGAAMRSYYELGSSLSQAWRVTRTALNRGENVLDGHATIQDEGYHQKAAADFSLAMQSGRYEQATLTAADILFNLPTRLLATSDEFFKQINYRTNVSSNAWAEGRQLGLRGDQLDRHIQDRVAASYDETGAGIDENALEYSRQATFTQDLKPGLAASLQVVKQMNPWMNLILPFVKTPANVLADWAYRSGLHADLYRDISAGGLRRNQALARLTMGATFYGMATYAVQSGSLTGMGPQNAETKKLWKAAGNQPYSMKVGDKWVSYNRFDPFGMFFGIAADIAEVGAHRDDRDGQHLTEMAVMSLSRNLSNKTYFRGLADVMDALFDRGAQTDDKIERVLNGYAGGFLPMSSYMASLKDDPNVREVRTTLDSVMNRVPGWSNELDPQRNVLGEIVLGSELGGASPVAMTTQKPDALAEELYHVFETSGEQVQKPPRRTGNIDWTTFKNKEGQSAYDRFLQLHQELGLRDKMTEVTQRPQYKELSAYGRAEAFRAVQGAIRTGARGKLFKEFPDLAEAVRQQERLQRLGMRAAPTQ